MSSLRPSTLIAATVGIAVTGFVGYAVYFDHKRRHDPDFRKSLKRQARKDAKIARSQAEASTVAQKKAIESALERAKEEGFPDDVEEREGYFMEQVAKGEMLSQDESQAVDSAICFYKALKVYPQPSDLISIYDKTVPKPVIDILAEMIARDPALSLRAFGGARPGSESGSAQGIDD